MQVVYTGRTLAVYTGVHWSPSVYTGLSNQVYSYTGATLGPLTVYAQCTLQRIHCTVLTDTGVGSGITVKTGISSGTIFHKGLSQYFFPVNSLI